MDYQGFTFANSGDVAALAARVTTLEGEVKTINTEITTLQGDVNALDDSVTSLQTSGSFANPATSVTLTGNVPANITPTLRGSPFVPSSQLVPGAAFRIRTYGQLTNASANNLSLYISLTNDGVNYVTDFHAFGLPIYVSATSVMFEHVITFNTLSTGGCTGSGCCIAYFNPIFVAMLPNFNVNPSSVASGINFYLWGGFDNVGSTLQIQMMTIEQIAGFF